MRVSKTGYSLGAFVGTVRHQLRECPKDFFEEFVGEGNVMTQYVKSLRRNVSESRTNAPEMVKELRRLADYLVQNSDITLDSESEESEEDKPVVVET